MPGSIRTLIAATLVASSEAAAEASADTALQATPSPATWRAEEGGCGPKITINLNQLERCGGGKGVRSGKGGGRGCGRGGRGGRMGGGMVSSVGGEVKGGVEDKDAIKQVSGDGAAAIELPAGEGGEVMAGGKGGGKGGKGCGKGGKGGKGGCKGGGKGGGTGGDDISDSEVPVWAILGPLALPPTPDFEDRKESLRRIIVRDDPEEVQFPSDLVVHWSNESSSGARKHLIPLERFEPGGTYALVPVPTFPPIAPLSKFLTAPQFSSHSHSSSGICHTTTSTPQHSAFPFVSYMEYARISIYISYIYMRYCRHPDPFLTFTRLRIANHGPKQRAHSRGQ